MSNWYLQNGKDSDVVISSRVRLARNLVEYNFPNKHLKDESKEVLNKLEEITPSLGYGLKFLRLENMDDITKISLMEKHLISPDFAMNNKPNKAIIINDDENICIMVNEEDHLRIQTFSKGLNLAAALRSANAIDDGFEKNAKYAFSPTFGYLTACPTNTGTGLRASVMMHLPALALSDLMDKVVRGLSQLGICVRGASGEGSDSFGSFFQISNQQTLGLSEADIIKKMSKFVKKVAEFEINAREKLSYENPLLLEDKFSRAKALLASCRLIDTSEALSTLSYIRFMADMSGDPRAGEFIEEIDSVAMSVKPAHLTANSGLRDADSQKRDALRASILNEFAKKIPNI